MLYYSGLLVVAAFISAVLGFVVFSGPLSWIPRVLFMLLMVLLAISLVRRKRPGPRGPDEDQPW